MDMVLARHKEGIAWIKDVSPEWQITVMNSSGEPVGDTVGRTFVLHPMIDAGVESLAYCLYILTHYESLAPWTLFCQANPLDHAAAVDAAGVAPSFIERLKQLPELMADEALWFIPIGNYNTCSIDEPLPFKQARMFPRSKKVIYNMRRTYGTLGEEVLTPLYPLKDLYGYLFRPTVDIPRLVSWSWGNMFAVRREAILGLHMDFWKRLSETLDHAPKPLEGTAMERLWPAILQEGYKRYARTPA